MRTARTVARLAATLAVPLLLAAASPGAAMDMKAPAGGAPKPSGVLVREATVAGHKIAYRLYTWEERNVLMKGMMGMAMAGVNEKGTHHLMVFVTGADGKPVTGAKVGFLVKGPDGAEQKTLTMGMYDGYGADLALGAKGAYAVKLKADLGGTVLSEEFVQEVP